MENTNQPSQVALDGQTVLYRWKVVLSDGKHYITWAATADDARAKIEPRLIRIIKVESAPPMG